MSTNSQFDDRTLEALAKRIGGVYSNGQAYVPGPGRSPKDRGLAISIGDNGKPILFSHHGDDYRTCAAYLNAHLSGQIGSIDQPARRNAPSKHAPNVDAKNIAISRSIWDEAVPLTGTCPGSRYLKSRCLGAPYRSSMRFHSGLSTIDGTGQKFPAIVSLISHAYGDQFSGIHITLIEPDGTSKAKGVEVVKRMKGKIKEAGVWPDNYGDTIVIAEGIESALSAERHFGIPAVAALSASGMKGLYVPSTIRTVIIVADNDTTGIGREAALETALRLMQRDVKCLVREPSWEGKDANDIQMMEPANHLVDVNRKSKPLLDAATYGGGVSLIPTAPFDDPAIKFGILKGADPKQPEWPRMAAYFDLLRFASIDDEVHSYKGIEVALRTGDLLAAQDFLATRWNNSRNAVRSFLNELVERGLISTRRPETPSGKVIRNAGDTRIPDVLEMPKIPLVPIVDEHGLSLRKSSRNSTNGNWPNFTNGEQADNYIYSMGYEVVKVPSLPAVNEQNLPQSTLYVEGEGYSFSAHSKHSASPHSETGTRSVTSIRAPVLQEWIAWIPPRTKNVPWYGVPPELQKSGKQKAGKTSPTANRGGKRKRVLTPKGGA